MREDKLKRILALFEDSGIEELEVEYGFWRGTRLRISRRKTVDVVAAPAVAAAPPVASAAPAEAAADSAAPAALAPPVDDGLHQVFSPMVGTFYRSSSPESDPFVQEGATVKKGQTLCIIEAMKIMNEITVDEIGRAHV